jgi:UDP-N-acetylglucosamine 4,6-dehydratase/5-epimerase
MENNIFKDKILLITGGIGSFGNTVLRKFLSLDIQEIRIFSRDEKKQDAKQMGTHIKKYICRV